MSIIQDLRANILDEWTREKSLYTHIMVQCILNKNSAVDYCNDYPVLSAWIYCSLDLGYSSVICRVESKH